MKKLLLLSFIILPIVLFGQRRKKPDKQLEKAPGAGYHILSDGNGEYQHTLFSGGSGVDLDSITNFQILEDSIWQITLVSGQVYRDTIREVRVNITSCSQPTQNPLDPDPNVSWKSDVVAEINGVFDTSLVHLSVNGFIPGNQTEIHSWTALGPGSYRYDKKVDIRGTDPILQGDSSSYIIEVSIWNGIEYASDFCVIDRPVSEDSFKIASLLDIYTFNGNNPCVDTITQANHPFTDNTYQVAYDSTDVLYGLLGSTLGDTISAAGLVYDVINDSTFVIAYCGYIEDINGLASGEYFQNNDNINGYSTNSDIAYLAVMVDKGSFIRVFPSTATLIASADSLSNVGAGTSLYKGKNNNLFEMKSLTGSGGITITPGVDEVDIGFSGGASQWVLNGTDLYDSVDSLFRLDKATGELEIIGHPTALSSGIINNYVNRTRGFYLSGPGGANARNMTYYFGDEDGSIVWLGTRQGTGNEFFQWANWDRGILSFGNTNGHDMAGATKSTMMLFPNVNAQGGANNLLSIYKGTTSSDRVITANTTDWAFNVGQNGYNVAFHGDNVSNVMRLDAVNDEIEFAGDIVHLGGKGSVHRGFLSAGATDVNGRMLIVHGAGFTPDWAQVQGGVEGQVFTFVVDPAIAAFGSTSFIVTVYDSSGTLVTSTSNVDVSFVVAIQN